LAFDGPEGIAARVSAQPGVVAVAPRIEGEALASGPEKTRGVLVVGVDPARENGITTLARAVKTGSYLDAAEPNGILLGDRVAEILRVAVGEEVTLVTQAADGSIGAGRYRVRGIYDSGIDMIDSAYVFLTLPAAQSLYALEGRVTTLAVRLDELGAVPGTSAALSGKLGATFEVLGWQKLLPRLADNVAFHELFTYIILFVVFVVVTLGIANTILMGVMERIREFGVMMALGTAPGQIARVVLYEAALLGLAGIAAGNAIGLGIVEYFSRRGIDLGQYAQAVQMMPGLTGIVYPRARADHLLFLSALLLATTVAASLYPAWKAAGFTPVEAIRGVRAALGRQLRRLPRIALPFPVRAVFARIALRGLARNPRRAALTLGSLGAGLAAYLFLSALAQGFFLQMRDNATGLVTGHLQIEVKGFRDELDAKLALANSAELLARVRASSFVAAATPRLQAMAMMSSPTQSEPVMLYGVDPEAERAVTRLHRQVREGNYLSPDTLTLIPTGMETLTNFPSPSGRGQRVRGHQPSSPSLLPEGEGSEPRALARQSVHSEPSALRATSFTRREVVIGRKLAERLGVRLGEKIVVIAPAADGTLGSAALRVIGIFETDNDVLDRNVALMTLPAARELLGVPREAATIAVRLKEIEALDTAAALLAGTLTASGQEVVTWKMLLPEAVQMLELIRVNLYIILLVVFTVVALGVVNTLLMAVLERTREFGLQLALGTRPGQIVRTVLYESFVLGVLGLAAGVVLGSLIVGYYHSYGFDLTAYAAATKAIPGMTGVVYPTIVPGNVWLPVAALLVTSLAAALYPAWRAARLDAIQALRHV
ncbi:MAG: ABC transporter permease, partial [Proteobacteria bacterium]|nr:ABC transporter permease [Pseudomonadota bacterium]